MDTTWKAGLEDVIAARSAITAIDGATGRLYHRGYEIGELADHASFEETTHLLWFGELPSAPAERDAFASRLRAAREVPRPVLALLRALPRDTHPLDALRTAVSLAATVDPDRRAGDADANLRKALRLTTLIPGVVAAWQRLRTGHDPVPADTEGSHAAHFLRLLHGRPPAPDVAQVLDTILTLHADHELNASTFAVRVAVATLADLHAALVGGDRHAQGAAPRRRQRGRAGHAAGDRRSRAGRGVRRRPAGRPRARHPAPSGRTRGPGSPASAIGSTGWTTPGRACSGRWRRRWPRRPGTPGSSRSPRASTRR